MVTGQPTLCKVRIPSCALGMVEDSFPRDAIDSMEDVTFHGNFLRTDA